MALSVASSDTMVMKSQIKHSTKPGKAREEYPAFTCEVKAEF